MKVNKELEQIFEQIGIPRLDGYAFCILHHFGFQDWLLQKDLINLEKAAGLLKLNEDGNYELKYKVFEAENITPFKEFIKALMDTNVMNTKGHVNNQMDSSVITVDKETEEAFKEATGEYKDFDIKVACAVIVEYYRTTRYSYKLSNFFKKGFKLEYERELG